ncbi:Domain of unknown function DUF4371, partial [Cinara cedri]
MFCIPENNGSVQEQEPHVNRSENVDQEIDQTTFRNATVEYLVDKFNLELLYPTDRGHFNEDVSDSLKRSILLFGSYWFQNSTFLAMLFCNLKKKLICESCWLFANRNNSNYRSEWISEQHISKEAEYWRNILRRIIKVLLTLTAGNTALRGNEGKKSDYKPEEFEGNFMRKIRLLADFDPLLHELLNDSTKHIKYLSWKVQNELIDILSENLCHIICEEIISCSFFSINSRHNKNRPKSFLRFYALEHHESMDYAHLIQNVLHKHNIKIQNCRGQGYDGTSVMSGQYSGVQKRINYTVPTASFVHCYAHNLIFVISDASKISPSISTFFETLQNVFNFFSSSGPRWASLALGDNTASKIRRRILQSTDISLENASMLLDKAIQNMQHLRNYYSTIYLESKRLCDEWELLFLSILRDLNFVKEYLERLTMIADLIFLKIHLGL